MKESDWRSLLIKKFNDKFKEKGFIWANDVRYKAGFPDLLVIIDGFATQCELKLWKRETFDAAEIVESTLSKLQIAVAKRITKAGGAVFALIYMPHLTMGPRIFRYYFQTESGTLMTEPEFYEWWLKPYIKVWV